MEFEGRVKPYSLSLSHGFLERSKSLEFSYFSSTVRDFQAICSSRYHTCTHVFGLDSIILNFKLIVLNLIPRRFSPGKPLANILMYSQFIFIIIIIM